MNRRYHILTLAMLFVSILLVTVNDEPEPIELTLDY